MDPLDGGSKEFFSQLVRLRYPPSPENFFAVTMATTPVDIKPEVKPIIHEGAFSAVALRDCFFDDFNETLDLVLLGGITVMETRISAGWRISTANDKYALCSTYPKRVVVPAMISDPDLVELAKFHKKRRFPVVSWRSPMNKCVLMRAAVTKYPRGNVNQRSLVDEQFCDILAESSPHERLVIVTEKEATGLMNDLLNRVSQKNLAFSYPSLSITLFDPSVGSFSLEEMALRHAKFVSVFRTGLVRSLFSSPPFFSYPFFFLSFSPFFRSAGKVIWKNSWKLSMKIGSTPYQTSWKLRSRLWTRSSKTPQF